jgi:hypothetical protein
MADTIDRAVYEVETRRTGDRNAIRGVRDEILSTQQVQRAAREFDTRYASQTSAAQRQIIQVERERRAGVSEDLRLLSLRVQTTNVANASEIAAIRESLIAQREYQQGARASQQENLRLVQVTQQLERRVDAYTAAQLRANRGTAAIPVERIRMGGNAVTALAFAAEQSALGGRQAVVAFGNLAQTLSFVSQSAKFASWAGWIGAAVTVTGTFVSLLSRADDLEKRRSERLRERDISDLDVHTVDRERTRLQGLLSAAQGQQSRLRGINIFGVSAEAVAGLLNVGKFGEIKRLETEIAAVEDRRADLLRDMAQSESRRIRQNSESLQLSERALAIEHDLLRLGGEASDRDIAIARVRGEVEEHQRAIVEHYRNQRDAAGHLLPLTQAQEQSLSRQVQLMRDIGAQREAEIEREKIRAQAQSSVGFAREFGNAPGRFSAQLFEIEQVRISEEKLYGDSAIAQERAETRKRHLYRQTAREAAQSFGTIHDALIKSQSRELKAIAHIADSIRRFHIGAEAAVAAVQSARAFGNVPRALADHDWTAAALYAKAGLELGAAAAMGFREALGSGGAGGGGGGGGGIGAGSSFEPDRAASGEGGGPIVINLYTTDPDSPGAIKRAMWLMKRSQLIGAQLYQPNVIKWSARGGV